MIGDSLPEAIDLIWTARMAFATAQATGCDV